MDDTFAQWVYGKRSGAVQHLGNLTVKVQGYQRSPDNMIYLLISKVSSVCTNQHRSLHTYQVQICLIFIFIGDGLKTWQREKPKTLVQYVWTTTEIPSSYLALIPFVRPAWKTSWHQDTNQTCLYVPYVERKTMYQRRVLSCSCQITLFPHRHKN